MESFRVMQILEPSDRRNFSLRDMAKSKILKAYRFTRAEIDSAEEPTLFGKLEVGQCFVCRKSDGDFVAVKISGQDVESGENCVVIGGIFKIINGEHDFSIGSLLIGVRDRFVVFPIPGRTFDERERRALRNA